MSARIGEPYDGASPVQLHFTLPVAGSNVTREFPPGTDGSGSVTPQTVVFWSLVRSPMSRAAAGLIVVSDPFD